MNSSTPNPHDGPLRTSIPGSIDDTLRLIANAPVPAGIEERVHAALNISQPARILAWPAALGPSHFWAESGWMRATAAAAIVLVIGGGGWGVYMHVQHPPARVVVMPAAEPAGGGFSSAGAIRTPQTVKGPMVTVPPAVRTGKSASRKKPVPRPGVSPVVPATSSSAPIGK